MFSVVVALTKEDGMGMENRLPWHPRRLHLDMAFLKHLTVYGTADGLPLAIQTGQIARNSVIMGRKTWDSIPKKFKPMEHRQNIVITSNPELFAQANAGLEVTAAGSLQEAFDLAKGKHIFVLGGAGIYKEALLHPGCKSVFITRLLEHDPLPCDVHFPVDAMKLFNERQNITANAVETLNSVLPPSATIAVFPDRIHENGIGYCIELHRKGC